MEAARHMAVRREIAPSREPAALLADEAAMARVGDGDADALAVLFDRYKARLFGFLYRMVGERCLAEDLLGETFLRVY
jgi:DNA-directed RNA polymerase specialized sigma24 family protein